MSFFKNPNQTQTLVKPLKPLDKDLIHRYYLNGYPMLIKLYFKREKEVSEILNSFVNAKVGFLTVIWHCHYDTTVDNRPFISSKKMIRMIESREWKDDQFVYVIANFSGDLEIFTSLVEDLLTAVVFIDETHLIIRGEKILLPYKTTGTEFVNDLKCSDDNIYDLLIFKMMFGCLYEKDASFYVFRFFDVSSNANFLLRKNFDDITVSLERFSLRDVSKKIEETKFMSTGALAEKDLNILIPLNTYIKLCGNTLIL